MKTGISLLSVLLLMASGAALAQQPGQDQPGAQQPGQQQPGQQQPGQQPGQVGQQPGQQPGQIPETEREREREVAAADRPRDGEFLTRREQGQIRSDELVGSDVLDSAGESIGSVNELLIEEDGQIAALLVNVGGVVGVGGRTVAIPWDSADVSRHQEDGAFTDTYEVRTQMSRDQLENAPEFQDENDQTFGGR